VVIGRGAVALLLAAVAATTTQAQDRDRTVLYRQDGLTVRGHFQAGVNLVLEENLFWDLAKVFAPTSGFDADTVWLEGYVKPGISFERTLSTHDVLYGKLSGVLSGTLGTDAYDTGDTGRGTLEEAYVGYRYAQPGGVLFDLSGGRRELKLGTGMLIENGGSSGFERGALKLGPRKAWERAAIARIAFAGLQSTTFYLDPNETEANDSRNALAGTDARYDSRNGGYLGVTFAHVVNSEAPYPKAAPGGIGAPSVISGAREGLNALNAYARTDRFTGPLSGLFLTTDLAYEWNDAIDLRAWAARGQVGWQFEQHPWRPMLMYTFQTFSGDDPDTPTLERFDPLFFEGSPSAWATGSKSSFTFINSNVHAHQLTFSVNATPQDRITLRYAHIRANELRSPIQFGQATRFDVATGQGIVAGVTNPHLADDVFLEYFRIINQEHVSHRRRGPARNRRSTRTRDIPCGRRRPAGASSSDDRSARGLVLR
jgi:hypothetical protein